MRQLLLATVILVGIWPDSARAQCPAAIPSPANAFHVQCFTINKPVGIRCATAIEPAICAQFNTGALNAGYLTLDGYNYLVSIRFCAITHPVLPGIFDFCPEGCFAADTQILSSVTTDGEASYMSAQSVKPDSPLMSMADESSLDDVFLAQRSVKRIVAGPEDAGLYAFSLANNRTLRVTMHHPMVLDSGVLVEAKDVDLSMSFAGMDGKPVAIKSITREKPTGDVFNFETRGETQLSHIIVAEGVLVGDLKIQNELSDEEGSIALRR
jgi:hypothetical protein